MVTSSVLRTSVCSHTVILVVDGFSSWIVCLTGFPGEIAATWSLWNTWDTSGSLSKVQPESSIAKKTRHPKRLALNRCLVIFLRSGPVRFSNIGTQVILNETVQVSFQDSQGIPLFIIAPVVLDHLVGVQHIRADLTTPFGFGVFAT